MNIKIKIKVQERDLTVLSLYLTYSATFAPLFKPSVLQLVNQLHTPGIYVVESNPLLFSLLVQILMTVSLLASRHGFLYLTLQLSLCLQLLTANRQCIVSFKLTLAENICLLFTVLLSKNKSCEP